MQIARRLIMIAVVFLPLFFLTSLSACPAFGEGNISNHSIDVTVNLKTSLIEGIDTITYEQMPEAIELYLREGSEVLDISIGGKKINFTAAKTEAPDLKGLIRIQAALPTGALASKDVEIRYRSVFQSIDDARKEIRRGVAHVQDGVIGEEGVFLPSSSVWYPQEEKGISPFDLKVRLPAGYSSVSEGERMKARLDGKYTVERWRSSRPVDGADLVVARFIVEAARHGDIDIYTFFLTKDDALSKLYIDKTKAYLDAYSEEFGPYPFDKFAVVESFLPTGYGMPSFTLLGSSVLRLPFIPETSLGHEIAHNWWGNSVYVDERGGNWVEALTTYTADYRYEIKKGPEDAMKFRLDKLRGYMNFASSTDLAMKDFLDATTPSSRAVGYNKGMMVFNMLEARIGEKAFKAGLRSLYSEYAFKKASWKDIRRVFEKASGMDLERFFSEWVDKSGGPVVSLEKAETAKTPSGYRVSVTLIQRPPAYGLKLPVRVKTSDKDVWTETSMDGEREAFDITLEKTPLSIEIDPEHQVFRLLSNEELPPSFASFFGDKNGIIAIPSENPDAYKEIAELLSKDYGASVKKDTEVTEEDLGTRSILLLGDDNALLGKTASALERHKISLGPDSFTIEGTNYRRDGHVMAVALKNPVAEGKVICYISGEARRAKEAGLRLRYFAQWSYLVLPDSAGRPVKGMFEGKNALRRDF